MKNLSFLSIALLTFCVLFFSACKKDDELSTKDKLIGKWTYQSEVQKDYENGELVETINDNIEASTIEFKENETFIFNTADEDGATYTDTGSWTLENDLLTLSLDGLTVDVEPFPIKEITETKLVFFQDEQEVFDGITYRYTNEITLVK
jgi:hypothetical protein